MRTFERYGAHWAEGTTDLEIEMGCIKLGGAWKSKAGKECGKGLFFHYRRMQQLLWPDEDQHRWSDLILEQILQNDITILSGPKDSGKTHSMAKFALCDYWCFPEETLIIVSSTDVRSLEGRVWGDMKNLYRQGTERYPWLAGVVVDSKHAICTDDLKDESVTVRDMRRGILCVPCKTSSGGETNIASYVGMKQKRRRYLADEFQFMSKAMFDSLGNVNSGNFKLVAAGNPLGQGDPLDLISEPKGGWGSESEEMKTQVWENKLFLRSKTVSLVGLDSPNFDYPQDQPIKFWYLVNKDSIERTVAGYGKDSAQYWSQCVGKRKVGLMNRRVLTVALCEQNRAFEDVIWEGSKPTVKIGGLDAAYGGAGGDRCVGGFIEFGRAVGGKIVILVHPWVMVPVSVRLNTPPEEQIANWCRDYFTKNGVPPENFFYDATGRGSLGIPLARIWSDKVNPVEFGGVPSDRPVSLDHFTQDMKAGARRLMTCREHYSKFVTELWWSVRYAIESQQMRGLPKDVAEEGCMREWKITAGNRVEIETKEDMKERVGRSPDLFDWLCVCTEGARRRGFQISKMSSPEEEYRSTEWLRKFSEPARQVRERLTLNYRV